MRATVGAGPALFQLVRFWSRRWTMRVAEEVTGEQRRVQDVQILEAVRAAQARTSEVTVGDVAHQLGIDRSGASRFVADAVHHGYLRRDSSPQDSRRALITITEPGRSLLDGARVWQEDVFARLTADWDPDDVERFGCYLRRLADQLDDPITG